MTTMTELPVIGLDQAGYWQDVDRQVSDALPWQPVPGDEAIAGAALDVFDREPLPEDHPFRRLANVVATPHIGYVIKEMYALFYREVVEDIEAFLDGRIIREVTP